jgi:hypothetical protein
MKFRVVFASILVLVLIGFVASSSIGYIGGSLSQSVNFGLTATGQAFDPLHNRFVDVDLSVSGAASGTLTGVVELNVRGGDLNVENYGAFSVPKGYGILVQSNHYIILAIKITSVYGGQTAIWILRGKTGTIEGNTLPVLFSSSQVILPNNQRLNFNVNLIGIIAAA